jgi:predicted ATPase/signal transduction histidine kinase/tRNA A-37 threonylcarbamoyl transferase component Bud32
MNPIAGYTLQETLFTSSKSIVYRAKRDADNRPVVLKVLNAEFPSAQQLVRLHREYRVTRDIAVDGVIQVVGLERFGTSMAIVLEDFGAHSLAFLQPRLKLGLPELLSLASRLADILGRVHRRNVIHKDINPFNIIWNPETDELKLIDFSIAAELSREAPSMLSPHVLEGTLSYISPEATGRMNRAVDYRTDFYSLGVTLYELFTGQLPFTASDPMELVHCHIARQPVEPHVLAPHLPLVLSRIIMRLLAKCAEDRYQSAFALAGDLKRCQEALRSQGSIPVFEIGRGDFSERLQLPQKLYGRAQQVGELLAAFGRVASGATEMVLVSGYSGIGKSSLVHEVHKPIVERRGYFISGKFDQLNRNVPYASLIQAFRELARQLLTEPAEQLGRWKERLLSALGANAAVICEVIPEFELILGPQPKPPELPPAETQNRFNFTFEKFVRTVAAPEHPLVIFLDDLQWADLPSLQLVERLLTDTEARHLLLIGAYRDNEVSDSHPLFATMAQMRKAGATLSTLTLGPLSREHCIQWLMETLNCEAAQVEPLARLCLRQTEGNPFFFGQFLLFLCDQGMLAFDEKGRCWTWDIERIFHTPMSDNAVELMAAKIQGLPRETLDVLQLAACIGNPFDLKILSIVATRPLRDTSNALWAALKEGLLLPTGEAYKFIEDISAAEQLAVTRGNDSGPGAGGALDLWQVSYRFLHDRVQQAAYSLIPEERRLEVHLRIGQLMLSALEGEALDEQLFAIVGHLNRGAPLLGSQQERDRVAELNLAAGLKARASAAHTAAKEYLHTGIALLGGERWMRRHELALKLHSHAAESCWLSGDAENMELHVAQVLAHARDPLEKLHVYEIKCLSLGVSQHYKEAIEGVLEILSQLGIDFPRPVTPEHIAAASAEVTAALGGRSIQEFASLPPMTDPRLLAAMRLLNRLTVSAYVVEPLLCVAIVLRQVALALKHGNEGGMAFGYSMYSIVALIPKGDFEAAYGFGKLALHILEQYEAREYTARALSLWNAHLRHLKENPRDCLKGCMDAYLIALELGEIEFAGWLLFYYTTLSFLLGNPLEAVDASAVRWGQSLVQMKHMGARDHSSIMHQTVQNLRGLSADPCLLVGAVYDEVKMVPLHIARGDNSATAQALFYKAMIHVLLGRYAEAIELSKRAEPYMASMVGSFHVPYYHFFTALAYLALQPTAFPGERERAPERLAVHLAELKVWAEHAPMNHGARYTLIQAEQSRVEGDADKARTLFYRAMALAKQHQWHQDEALATERFASFLGGLGEREAARFFMAKARHLYQVWGAEAKVREMDRALPDLRSLALALSGSALAPPSEGTTSSEAGATHGGQSLDLLSILKASQAISGEVVLKDLLEKLLRIVVENAGARWGLLMLDGERSMVAVAKRASETGEFTITLHESRAQAPVDFSQALVRYVERTREVVVLGDASSDKAWRSDPYITARQPRSVLCMPIVYQKKQAGILYLENELLANAFTPERCKVLELLVAQAAISLENARLYDTLEMKVKERTRELSEALQRLQETQRQLVVQEKLASLGSLTSGIAHEIKNPLNFVNNFSQIAESLVSDLREEWARQSADPRKARPEIVEQLLGDLVQSTEKIRTHGSRADRIIRAMLEHARAAPRANQRMDINAVVREHVNLAMSGYKVRSGGARSAILLQADYDESIGDSLVAPEEIGRVILNLVGNALYALESRQGELGRDFMPRLEVKTQNLKGCFEIRIHDNGGGIPSAVRGKIFTPFFTTKPPGEGTGLGLSISYDIITSCGGKLEFSSVEGESTEFVVVLPKRGGTDSPGSNHD